jgi:hypothetical protein
MKPSRLAAVVAFVQTRDRNVSRRIGPPRGDVNANPSSPGGYFLTCSASSNVTNSGRVTHRRDPFVFGSPSIRCPASRASIAREPASGGRSRLPIRSPASSDYRSEPNAPTSTSARYRSGTASANRPISSGVRTHGDSCSTFGRWHAGGGVRRDRLGIDGGRQEPSNDLQRIMSAPRGPLGRGVDDRFDVRPRDGPERPLAELGGDQTFGRPRRRR